MYLYQDRIPRYLATRIVRHSWSSDVVQLPLDGRSLVVLTAGHLSHPILNININLKQKYLISLISSNSQSNDDMRGEGHHMKCIIHTKLRAVRLQTWPRAFNFIVGFVFQIFLFQIFGFQICRFTFKYWVCPTCLSLANFHQAFPPNRIITKRTDCRELGSENENISVKKCRASGSGIFHN